jgi:hypothetical protein
MIRLPRFFKCISKRDMLTVTASEFFTKGGVYQEAFEDIFGNENPEADIEDYTGSLLLYSDFISSDGYRMQLYVGIVDFELVKAPLMICLN